MNCPKCKSEMTEKALFTSVYYECSPCETKEKIKNEVTLEVSTSDGNYKDDWNFEPLVVDQEWLQSIQDSIDAMFTDGYIDPK